GQMTSLSPPPRNLSPVNNISSNHPHPSHSPALSATSTTSQPQILSSSTTSTIKNDNGNRRRKNNSFSSGQTASDFASIRSVMARVEALNPTTVAESMDTLGKGAPIYPKKELIQSVSLPNTTTTPTKSSNVSSPSHLSSHKPTLISTSSLESTSTSGLI